jgi:DNA-binding beta-propeller fold protein YncE
MLFARSTFITGSTWLLALLALAGAVSGQVVIVSSDFNDSVQMYDLNGASLGALVPTGGGGLDSPQGICVGPDGNVYVSSANTDQVLRYAPSGASLGQFQVGGGLDQPWFCKWGPDGKFYVSSSLTSQVLCYRADGVFDHVAAAGHGLFRPDGFSFDSGGNLFVSDFFLSNSRVQKFNPATGDWIADVVTDSGLRNPLENRLSADGQTLFVSSYGTNEVRKYSTTTGAFLGLAASTPLVGPVGQLVLPNGQDMLVTGWQANTIYKFDATTGASKGIFTTGGSLNHPNNLALLNIPEPCGIALTTSGVALLIRRRRCRR